MKMKTTTTETQMSSEAPTWKQGEPSRDESYIAAEVEDLGEEIFLEWIKMGNGVDYVALAREAFKAARALVQARDE